MRNINKLTLLLLILICTIGCENEENNNDLTLSGKWIYTKDYSKSLDFQSPDDVMVNGQDFLYKIEGDSIEFSYNGDLMIAIIPSKHRFEILPNAHTLMIEDLDRLQFFRGNEGENILSIDISPNDFIGYWINTELNDTLIFLTNEKMERPHGYYNDWYEYSYTTTDLWLQYSGPDKILVRETYYGYEFKGDTLLINFHESYYPNITSGLKKYLKRYSGIFSNKTSGKESI